MHRLARLLALLAVAGTAACTPSVKQIVRTTTTTTTKAVDMRPVDSGPTKAATAKRCPLIAQQAAADLVGMRLARITVLRSGGKVVGCRLYALQNSPLAVSERLPPANQPAIEITSTRYHSALAAQHALVLVARTGTHPQQATLHGTKGVCFQLDFYKKDRGRDWSCAYSTGSTLVQVKTVVVTPALSAILLTRRIATP